MTRAEFKIWFDGFLAGSSERSIEQKQCEIDRRLPANMNTREYEMVNRRAITWHKHAIAAVAAHAPVVACRSVPMLGTIGDAPKRAKSVSDAA